MRLIGLMVLLLWLTQLHAAERAALVIGNAAYEVGRLVNPKNDANDMAAALRALEFDVTVATDLDRAGMLETLDRFRTRIQPGGLALVYYSGHGVEVGGENWLLPVRNREIGTQAQVRIHSVSARDVLQTLEEGGARLNLLVLDACRDNPLPAGARSSGRGFVPMSTGSSTLIAYSTSPGRTAADGTGRNSPYTAALVQVLKQPDVQIPDLFNQVGAEVLRSTSGAQVPWNSNTPIWPPILLAGGASAIPRPLPEGGALGELRIEVSPADAQVYIDGALVGEGGQTLLSLPSNTTREVEARRAGYQSQAIRAYIKAGEATMVRVKLSAQTTSQPPVQAPAVTTAASAPAAQPSPGSAGGLTPLQRFRDCESCPEMVVIPAGSFLMGSPASEAERESDEGPQRRVQVTSFAMGRTEVAFAEYDRFAMASNRELPSDLGWGRGEQPVINVSWEDANAYAHWLSAQTGQRYRLPSEAEWEYAARAGTTGPFSFEGAISPAKANYYSIHSFGGSREDSSGFRQKTVAAGSLPANPWGLHKVHGNVHEWVQDCYKDTYAEAPNDGSAVEVTNCKSRVHRGGSWIDFPDWLRSADRDVLTPSLGSNSVGFRLARTF